MSAGWLKLLFGTVQYKTLLSIHCITVRTEPISSNENVSYLQNVIKEQNQKLDNLTLAVAEYKGLYR